MYTFIDTMLHVRHTSIKKKRQCPLLQIFQWQPMPCTVKAKILTKDSGAIYDLLSHPTFHPVASPTHLPFYYRHTDLTLTLLPLLVYSPFRSTWSQCFLLKVLAQLSSPTGGLSWLPRLKLHLPSSLILFPDFIFFHRMCHYRTSLCNRSNANLL